MSTTKQIDDLLKSFLERGIPGCSLKVVQRGNILYEGHFGVLDIDTKKPVDKTSVYRQASMSKIPLYTAMMMLFEQGKFLLTDPVSEYFPSWKESRKYVIKENGKIETVPTKRPVTIKDTLTMGCGLPYCNFDGPTDDITLKGMQDCMRPLWQKGHFTLEEQIDAISKAPLACEPGERWIYGFSSELAAGIIQKICDKNVNDVLKEMLFDPLEMTSTGPIFFGNIQERMVTLYAKNQDGKLVPGPDFFDKKHLPGKENEQGWARLFSTVDDYSNLLQMLACGGNFKGRQIMGRKTIDLMRTNTLSASEVEGFGSDPYNAGYGYGYGFRTALNMSAGNLNSSKGAFGWTGGFGSYCEADPEEGLSIVYMHNLMPDDEQYCHPRVRNASYGLVK